jgi:hypothetical protein
VFLVLRPAWEQLLARWQVSPAAAARSREAFLAEVAIAQAAEEAAAKKKTNMDMEL